MGRMGGIMYRLIGVMHNIILSILYFIGVDHKPTPARLHKKQSFREKYEGELILAAGAGVIIVLFLFAFYVVGPMDPYTNGGLV